jgi:hypothetical protein
LLLGGSSPAEARKDPDQKQADIMNAEADRAAARAGQARSLNAEGIRLFGEGALAAALAKFEQSYQLMSRPDVLFNLAKTNAALGNSADALNAFDELIAKGSSEEMRRRAQDAADALRPKVGYLDIETNEAGASVSLDGRAVGFGPLHRTMAAMSGPHQLRLERADGSESQPVSVSVGQTIHVALKFGRPAARAATSGTVCVEHLSRSDADWAKGSMRKVSRSVRFELTIDGRPPVEISAQRGALIADLDLSRSHQVEVTLRHKPYARFVLDFAGHDHLGLRFDPFYGEWHVATVEPSAECSR